LSALTLALLLGVRPVQRELRLKVVAEVSVHQVAQVAVGVWRRRGWVMKGNESSPSSITSSSSRTM